MQIGRFALALTLLLFSSDSILFAQQAEGDRRLFEEARAKAEKGDALAQFNLALMYFQGIGCAKNPAEGVKWCRSAAEQGSARAQNTLGVIYNADGAAKDEAEACRWYRKAAEQGDAMAQLNLGVMYAKGTGVVKDEVEA